MTERRRSTTARAAAWGMAASLLLAGCSSASPSPGKTAPVPDGSTTVSPTAGSAAAAPEPAAAATAACSLVTEQEAGAALGADPGRGQAVSSHGASSCMYGASPAIVTVNVVPARGKAAYDHVRAQAGAGQLVDIAGVGDAAFGTFSGPAASVQFYKGDTFVAVVLFTGRAGASPKDQVVILAKTAAGRL